MINITNPVLAELQELNERRHIWNYFNDEVYDDLFKEHIEKIYNYFRHTLIEKLNNQKNQIHGTGNAISFKLPLRYMQFPESEYMKELTFSYTPDITKNNINSLMSVQHIDENNLRMNIFCDMYRYDFKPLFFHEMKDYVQLSKMSSHFVDYYKIAYEQNGSKVFKDKDIIKLIKLVDMLNPQEQTAYLEQIYNEAYYKIPDITNSYTLNDLILDMMKKFNIDNDTIHLLIDKIKNSNFEFEEYITTLFLINCHELTTKQHHYTFFKQHDYNLQWMKDIRKHLETVANDKNQLGDLIERYAQEIMKDKVLIDNLKKSFIKNFTQYKRTFLTYLSNVIYSAKEDYDNVQNSSLAKQMNQQVLNYIRYNDAGEVVIEVICSDDYSQTYHIFEIIGNSISNAIRKIKHLFKIVDESDNDFELDFGFNYSFENRLSLLGDKPVFEFEIEIQTIDDVAEAVKLLNNCNYGR